MTFFLDNNLSRQLAAGMAGFGESAMHLLDVFPHDAPDVAWLQYVGEHGHLLVTRDERVRWNPAEIQALKHHKVGAFFLAGKSRSRCQLIQQLVRSWPQMKDLAAKTRRPFAFRVPPTGGRPTPISLG